MKVVSDAISAVLAADRYFVGTTQPVFKQLDTGTP